MIFRKTRYIKLLNLLLYEYWKIGSRWLKEIYVKKNKEKFWKLKSIKPKRKDVRKQEKRLAKSKERKRNKTTFNNKYLD